MLSLYRGGRCAENECDFFSGGNNLNNFLCDEERLGLGVRRGHTGASTICGENQ